MLVPNMHTEALGLSSRNKQNKKPSSIILGNFFWPLPPLCFVSGCLFTQFYFLQVLFGSLSSLSVPRVTPFFQPIFDLLLSWTYRNGMALHACLRWVWPRGEGYGTAWSRTGCSGMGAGRPGCALAVSLWPWASHFYCLWAPPSLSDEMASVAPSAVLGSNKT